MLRRQAGGMGSTPPNTNFRKERVESPRLLLESVLHRHRRPDKVGVVNAVCLGARADEASWQLPRGNDAARTQRLIQTGRALAQATETGHARGKNVANTATTRGNDAATAWKTHGQNRARNRHTCEHQSFVYGAMSKPGLAPSLQQHRNVALLLLRPVLPHLPEGLLRETTIRCSSLNPLAREI